jgi:hypothetical protein
MAPKVKKAPEENVKIGPATRYVIDTTAVSRVRGGTRTVE